ncbi:hypothetical protein AVEN_74020-1, partial [Araneus ventricosus]
MIFLPLCDRWSVRVRRRDAGERFPVRRGARQHGPPPAAQLPADPAAREGGAARQLPGGQKSVRPAGRGHGGDVRPAVQRGERCSAVHVRRAGGAPHRDALGLPDQEGQPLHQPLPAPHRPRKGLPRLRQGQGLEEVRHRLRGERRSDPPPGIAEGPLHPAEAGGGASVPAPTGIPEAPERARKGRHQEHRHRRPHQERADSPEA